MAHELTINKVTGKVEMFYCGATPWHQLGTHVAEAPDSNGAMAAAGLNWTVEKRPLFEHILDGDGVVRAREIKSHVAVFRTDTNERLSIVGTKFPFVQNREMFDFCDTLVGEGNARYETAGSTKGGRRIWALMKTPSVIEVVPNDIVQPYIFAANGHDGCLAFTAGFTGTRIVCNNTLNAALGESGVRFRMSVRHNLSLRARVDEARRVLGMSVRYFEVMGQNFKALAAKQINEMVFRGYVNAVFPLKRSTIVNPMLTDAPAVESEERARVKAIHETVAFLFENGRGNAMPGVRGTAWAALNAVTEYVDHVGTVTGKGELRKGAALSALFGPGAQIKERAFKAALSL